MNLPQFIKWQGVASTGGEAKYLVQSGKVIVNGSVETRRGRELFAGDLVCIGSQELFVDENVH